jgi:hypothetical protein
MAHLNKIVFTGVFAVVACIGLSFFFMTALFPTQKSPEFFEDQWLQTELTRDNEKLSKENRATFLAYISEKKKKEQLEQSIKIDREKSLRREAILYHIAYTGVSPDLDLSTDEIIGRANVTRMQKGVLTVK